jgi:hypothetical protein
MRGENVDWVCSTCGKRHVDLPLAFHVEAPDPWVSSPPEAQATGELSSDMCVLELKGDISYFIRGLLEIPVIDGPGPFAWGVWSTLSELNMRRAAELWEVEGRESEPPYFGWLANSLPLYPETFGLKVNVHTRPVGQRPFIEVEPTEHPLAVEQRDGIKRERVREIAEYWIHTLPSHS